MPSSKTLRWFDELLRERRRRRVYQFPAVPALLLLRSSGNRIGWGSWITMKMHWAVAHPMSVPLCISVPYRTRATATNSDRHDEA